jgi:hypothetical protein
MTRVELSRQHLGIAKPVAYDCCVRKLACAEKDATDLRLPRENGCARRTLCSRTYNDNIDVLVHEFWLGIRENG